MAQVFTSSVPTETVFDTATSLIEATVTSRSLVVGTSTVTSTVLETTPPVGPGQAPVTATEIQIIESLFTSTSVVLSEATATSLIETPVDTLYNVILSTSTAPTTTQTTTSAATLALTRNAPGPQRQPATTTSDDGVVVVTQYTTITPTSVSSEAAAATSSSGGAAVSGADANAADGTSRGDEGGAMLGTGAIAGIAIGGLAAIALLGLLGFLFWRRRRGRNDGKRDSMYGLSGPNEKLASTDVFNPSFTALPRSGPGDGGSGGAGVLAGAAAGAGATAAVAGRRLNRDGTRHSSQRNLPPVSNLAYTAPSNNYATSNGHLAVPSSNRRTLPPLPNRESLGAAGPAMLLAAGQPNARNQQPSQQQRNRTSAPSPSALASPPAQEESAITRAASMKSIPSFKLGKGAGYASPMAPMDHMGKPIDQKTWRERNSFIASGISPDTPLTAEQKLRRDSQMAKLQAAYAGTASAAPGLSTQKEVPEPTASSSILPPAAMARSNASRVSAPPVTPSQPVPNAASHPASIIPSFPPTSASRGPPNVSSPSHQASYQVYQSSPSVSTPPIRASFLGPAPTSSPSQAPYRQSQQFRNGSFAGPSTYSPQLAGVREQGSFSDSGGLPRAISIADDIYGGLTSGLSDRDISRLSMQPQNGRR